MSESAAESSVSQAPIPNDFAGAGRALRAAREAQGLHIGVLAVTLKVPVKKLEALESGRYDQLPDVVFVRALALSVCRVLKIDSEPILAGLPILPTQQIKNSDAGLNAVFQGAGAGIGGALRSQLTSPIGIGALLMLVATVVILLWAEKPRMGQVPDQSTTPAAASVTSGGQGSNDSPLPANDAPLALKESLPNLPSASAIVPVADLSGKAAELSSMTAASDKGLSVLELKAAGESWVEVQDATGRSVLRKLTKPGEVLTVAGKLPLAVVVGRADQVTVSVRGTPLDIMSLAKENVARFEVK